MKWAIVTTVLIGLFVLAGAFSPLVHLTPTISEITDTIENLETELRTIQSDPSKWPAVRAQVTKLKQKARETDRLIRLVSGIDVYLDFERTLSRIAAAATAEDASSMQVEVGDLQEIWQALLSF